jgi:hypothetical protein
MAKIFLSSLSPHWVGFSKQALLLVFTQKVFRSSCCRNETFPYLLGFEVHDLKDPALFLGCRAAEIERELLRAGSRWKLKRDLGAEAFLLCLALDISVTTNTRPLACRDKSTTGQLFRFMLPGSYTFHFQYVLFRPNRTALSHVQYHGACDGQHASHSTRQ